MHAALFRSSYGQLPKRAL